MHRIAKIKLVGTLDNSYVWILAERAVRDLFNNDQINKVHSNSRTDMDLSGQVSTLA